MGFTIQLARNTPAPATDSTARKGTHKARRKAAVEVLDTLIEDGEITRVVDREGPDRLPVLARLDPYADHVLDAYWCELLLAELGRIDDAALTPSEASVLDTLKSWAQRCAQAPDGGHTIRFTGD
ncbi:hypothetical protein JS756_33450 [Streptomyces actuosus]|uniref:Uncharacterized protein n=1 Tax=Streptomyces actuosus TaxID=1885 RepID=A0ABS2W0I1_STRAS|nr:hypothetical protein [Streptomyces actuosus]MBN0048907.1 hypothetical protein [Streptomyces actuosus]